MEKVRKAAVPFIILDLYKWMKEGWNTSPQVLEAMSFRVIGNQAEDPQAAAHMTIAEIFKKFPENTTQDVSLVDMHYVYLTGLAYRLGLVYGVSDTEHGERIIRQRLQNNYVLHPEFDSLTKKLAGRAPTDAEVLLLAERFCEPRNRDGDDESSGETAESLVEFVQSYGSRDTVSKVMRRLVETAPITAHD